MVSSKDEGCSDALRRQLFAKQSEWPLPHAESVDWIGEVKEFGDAYSTQQELAIVTQCLRSGAIEPIEWAHVPVKYKDHEGVVAVAIDCLRLWHPSGAVRVNVSCFGAQMLCDSLGLQMPTPLVVDRAWEEANVRLTPKTYTPDANGRVHIHNRSGQSEVVSMTSVSAMIAHSDRVSSEVDGRRGLVGNAGKWWVICKRIGGQKQLSPALASYKAANYGWFASGAASLSVTGKKLWQSIGTAHDQFHRDYSQTFVPVGRHMLVDGYPMSFAYVLGHPELCGLVSHEGPLAYDRHPNLPVWTPPGSGSVDLSPRPTETR